MSFYFAQNDNVSKNGGKVLLVTKNQQLVLGCMLRLFFAICADKQECRKRAYFDQNVREILLGT